MKIPETCELFISYSTGFQYSEGTFRLQPHEQLKVELIERGQGGFHLCGPWRESFLIPTTPGAKRTSDISKVFSTLKERGFTESEIYQIISRLSFETTKQE